MYGRFHFEEKSIVRASLFTAPDWTERDGLLLKAKL
jgi:hypothetical protein